MLERAWHLRLLLAALLAGCGAPLPHEPPTVRLAQAAPAEDAPTEPGPWRARLDETPAPKTCPKVAPKSYPCHLVPKCSGRYGSGSTPLELECSQLMWFGFWTDEAMADAKELLALQGTISGILGVVDGVRLTTPKLRSAVDRYRAALRREKHDSAALAQAICAGDSARRDAFRNSLRADVADELAARVVITDICHW